jgi:hypothetical protein
MFKILKKIGGLYHKIRRGIKIQVSEHFFIVIRGLYIYYIYKPEKESIIEIGDIRC